MGECDTDLGVDHEDVRVSYVSSRQMQQLEVEFVEDLRDDKQAVHHLTPSELDVGFVVDDADVHERVLGSPLEPRAPQHALGCTVGVFHGRRDGGTLHVASCLVSSRRLPCPLPPKSLLFHQYLELVDCPQQLVDVLDCVGDDGGSVGLGGKET